MPVEQPDLSRFEARASPRFADDARRCRPRAPLDTQTWRDALDLAPSSRAMLSVTRVPAASSPELHPACAARPTSDRTLLGRAGSVPRYRFQIKPVPEQTGRPRMRPRYGRAPARCNAAGDSSRSSHTLAAAGSGSPQSQTPLTPESLPFHARRRPRTLPVALAMRARLQGRRHLRALAMCGTHRTRVTRGKTASPSVRR